MKNFALPLKLITLTRPHGPATRGEAKRGPPQTFEILAPYTEHWDIGEIIEAEIGTRVKCITLSSIRFRGRWRGDSDSQDPPAHTSSAEGAEGGLSFCRHVAIYSNRLSEKKARRWMAGDACNDAAHEVIGKPKLEPAQARPGQTRPKRLPIEWRQSIYCRCCRSAKVCQKRCPTKREWAEER